ncbi:MAG: ribonuclease HII [Limnochordaceae bacterium]|nr:ribonuclease HII [Limnochordaceae bacterium]
MAALRQWVQELGATEDEWDELAADPRPEVQQLAAKLDEDYQRITREWHRLQAMAREEEMLRQEGYQLVAGIDEAGRGPLAGPVVAAAVVFPPNVWIPGVRDSKTLSPQQREFLFPLIQRRALAVGVGVVDQDEIDRTDILRATLQAMQQAVAQLGLTPDYCLIDGLQSPVLPCPSHCLVGGDGCCFSIAAASIVAKVHRDRLMAEMDRRYPGYGFAENKGYPTPAHRKALAALGPSPIHRRSFHGVKEPAGDLPPATAEARDARA